jgi:biotin transport system substrate-specific component
MKLTGIAEGSDRAMAQTPSKHVLTETILPAEGAALWTKRAVLVVLGVALHIAAAKIAVPVWPSPVPITMGSFAVLMLGAAYGPRLGLVTIMAYMALGAFGWDVFAGTSAELNGIAYMMGGTGGYLVGWVLATLALGLAARRGWDRSIGGMAAAMAIGTVLVYVPGLLWLGMLYGWDKPILDWGLYPFLIGDALKLALAALIMPGLWKLVGDARA